MEYVNNWIKVKELKKDFTVDGFLEKYDDSSPTFFGKVIDADKEIKESLFKNYNIDNIVLQLSRGNKTQSLGGYLVRKENIISIMTEEEFNSL